MEVLVDIPISLSILHHFDSLEDPRIARTRKHLLLDMIAISLCGVLCGANDWVAVALWGRANLDWLKTFLELPNGIPAHDTFGRVFALLDPEQFADCFAGWMAAVCARLGLKQVAIDGKALRRSHDRGKGKAALHLVSAWAVDNGLTLGQRAVHGKSNEITAIPELLRLLDVAGALVTIDAMGCQKDIAAAIRAEDADYLLAVKENQPKLYEDIDSLMTEALDSDFAGLKYDYAEASSQGHGRREERSCWVFEDVSVIRERSLWTDLQSLVVVVSTRTVGDKSSSEMRYYISSRLAAAEAMLQAVRRHWSIENECHWVLDVCFGEDDSRLRAGHGAENFALLRKVALALLRKAKGVKAGIEGRRLAAGWDRTYLLNVLLGYEGP
jgi:predicted transposase YbfD/YdcC